MPQNIVEYILGRIQNSADNIIINAEGGAGKTTAFIEIYRRLLKDEIYYNKDQRLIPIYIPLTACNVIDNSEKDISVNNALIRYLYEYFDKTYKEYLDFEANVSKMILNADECGFRYVFMLDAINENHNWRYLVTDILSLAKMKNVCVIVSSRSDISIFDSWHKISLKGIARGIVEEVVGEKGFDQKTEEMLSIPFYISKYMALKGSDFDLKSDSINRYTLLSAYFDNLFNKLLENNSRVIIAKELSYEVILKLSKDCLLPLICFEIMRNHTMFFSTSDHEMLNRIVEKLKSNGVDDEIADFICGNMNNVIESFFVSTGIFVKLDEGRFKILHEIYRDFLAAKYIVKCVELRNEITDEQIKISKDTLKLIAYPILGAISFTGEDGEYMPGLTENQKTEITIKAFFGNASSNKETDAEYFNFTFVYYNMLEYFHNGLPEKAEFCRSTEGLVETIFENLKLYFEVNPTCKKDYEQIRLYAEVLRRNRNFEGSINVSKELAEIAGDIGDWKRTAEHNEAKCYIYKAFDLAKNSSEFSEEAYMIYKKGLEILEAFSNEHYTLSSNLFAMLVAYPDPVSAPYMIRYIGDVNKQNLRVKGFFLNFNAAKSAYFRDKLDNSYNYPLKQCMIAMMNKDVSFVGNANKLKYQGIAGILKCADAFTEYNESFFHNTLKVAEIIMNYLRANDYSFALECLYVKLMLLRGDEIGEEIMTLLHMSKKEIISSFIISLIEKDNNEYTISELVDKLKKRAEGRMPDSFDAVYIQADLKAIWENFFCRGYKYSENYRKAVEEMLNCKL